MTSPETTHATGQAPDPDSRVGVGVTPFHSEADATIRLARRAEELGYARFGTAEGWTQDAVVLLAQIAGVTSRIGLATAVLPVWSRTPAAIAMAAASLQRVAAQTRLMPSTTLLRTVAKGLHGFSWGRELVIRDARPG